jgi:hypothetical protein
MDRTTVQKLGEIEVLDPNGATVRLGSLWDGRPILLAMIRHFG